MLSTLWSDFCNFLAEKQQSSRGAGLFVAAPAAPASLTTPALMVAVAAIMCGIVSSSLSSFMGVKR